MNRRVATSHGRVEAARQALVNAEEAYLRAHGWKRELYRGLWFWQWEVGETRIIMDRVDAVKFQHTAIGD